jgi:hypothetical protein
MEQTLTHISYEQELNSILLKHSNFKHVEHKSLVLEKKYQFCQKKNYLC